MRFPARVSPLHGDHRAELGAAIAHELRQPLTAIRTNAQALRRMLASGRADPAEVDEALADIAGDAVRADLIIQRLGQLLRKDEPELTLLDLAATVHEAEPLAREAAGASGVGLRVVLPHALPPVLGDRIQVQQVLLNLVRNGAEATCAARRAPDVEVRIAHAGRGFLELTVCDAGVGVDDAALARMFEPFYTTKPAGLGIGLALSRAIVEAHGGALWATRNTDRGVTMHCTLRVAPAGAL